MWNKISIKPMPEGVRVRTKISDDSGERCDAILKKQGNICFLDGGMYVYYQPTHWKYI